MVQNYIKYACKQMKDLEGKVFAIDGFHVTFKFQELPNDMKMLAPLAGELPNSPVGSYLESRLTLIIAVAR